MYAKILEKRTRIKVEPLLSRTQQGFRKGRGCTDALVTLRQICEKSMEYNKKQTILFIDQEKAFDRVDRNLLWSVLDEYGVQGHFWTT